jgi:GAF domain-containing protein
VTQAARRGALLEHPRNDPELDRRDQLSREARVVGLRHLAAPSLEAVERRRVQLWALSTVLLVLLSGMVVLELWTPRVVGNLVTPLVLRLSVLGLTLGFSIYSFEKELHLRRMSRLLLEERMQTLSNRVRELALLLEASRAMNSALELDPVLDAILRSALELLDGSSASVMLREGDELRSVCSAGENPGTDRVALGEGVAGMVAASGEAVLVNGRDAPHRFAGSAGAAPAGAAPAESSMCVPLVHYGELLGVINLSGSSTRTFTEYDLRGLSLFAEQAASAIVKARLFEAERIQAKRLSHLAFHDPLTGLPNRVLFIDRTRQALARSERASGAVAVLQVRERQSRPRRRRRDARTGGELPSGGAAPGGHPGPLRRRRVRGPVRRARGSDRRCRPRHPSGGGGDRRALRAERGRGRHHRQHRHRCGHRSRRRPRHAGGRRRHGDVSGQGAGQGPPRDLRR